MAIRMISITEELNILLKKEDNASGLITRLLWDYFNTLKEPVNETKPLITQLEDNDVKIRATMATNSLRDTILEEIARQEKEEDLVNEVFAEEQRDFYENR